MAGWRLPFPGFHKRPQPLLERRLKGIGLSFKKYAKGIFQLSAGNMLLTNGRKARLKMEEYSDYEGETPLSC